MTKRSKPKRQPGVPLTPVERAEAQRIFLDHFSVTANVMESAEQAGVNRKSVYAWLKTDPDFKAAYDHAHEDARDHLRKEIRRRAVEGWLEPVYQKGEKVGTIRRYSDTLLATLARAHLPEHRVNQIDVTTGGQPLNYANILASPELTDIAARLAEAASLDSSGLGPDSEPDVSDSQTY